MKLSFPLLIGAFLNLCSVLLTWYSYSTYGDNTVWFTWVPLPMAALSMAFLVRYELKRKSNEV